MYISIHPCNHCIVSTVPRQPFVKETLESDSTSQAVTMDSVSTPQETLSLTCSMYIRYSYITSHTVPTLFISPMKSATIHQTADIANCRIASVSYVTFKEFPNPLEYIFRRATESPWFNRNTVVRASSNIPTIRTFVDGLTSSFEEAAESSPWEHIQLLQAQEVPRLRPTMDD
ncbi:hypothetical protein J6590_090865 [Homalodisca vitripennis]|nr:hypothetical protein J6590_090865 [Homalodisca vitripennis]